MRDVVFPAALPQDAADAVDAPAPRPVGDEDAEDADDLGVLADESLATVAATLSERRVTGLLHVGELGELWFDRGAIYLANGPSSPSLFDVLLAAEVAARPELEALCAEADAGGGYVVDRLAPADSVGQGRLRRLLHEHVLGALFELMVSAPAPLALEVGARHVLGSRHAQPAGELLAEVELRLGLWRRVAQQVPSTAVRFRLAPSLPEGTERVVTADEWAFLALLDGRRTVADVITATGDSAFRVCAVLFRMLLEDLIEPADA